MQAQAVLYAEAVQAVNERYKALITLKAEANGLTDRLGVAAPTFSPVVLPSLRRGCREAAVLVSDAGFVDHHHVATATEKCEHGLRTRRTYQEVNGTPGATIIEAAGGAKAWPALTPKQGEIVAGRERERQVEAATAARFAGHAGQALSRRSL